MQNIDKYVEGGLLNRKLQRKYMHFNENKWLHFLWEKIMNELCIGKSTKASY